MPTYRYECRKCGEFHEEFQSMSDKPLTKCPKCGGRLDRLIGTGAGILLKGSGFHNTDYRSSSYKEASKGDSAPAASEKPAAASGGDSAAPKSEGASKGEPKKEAPKPAPSGEKKKGKKKE